MSQKNYLA